MKNNCPELLDFDLFVQSLDLHDITLQAKVTLWEHACKGPRALDT